jgi:G:T/U-mismatch repair DNA glycosylase
MITEHQYINRYPLNPLANKLILGTIHPHNYKDFSIPFFYGHKNTLWNILNDAYVGILGTPITLNNILTFLDSNSLTISDTIIKCKRKSNNALDKNLIPLQLNTKLIEEIRNSNIQEIFFTSGFSTNNAFKLFYCNLLKMTISSEIRNNKGCTLDQKIFGRPIKLTVLYSPSGRANAGIARSKEYLEKFSLYKKSKTPVKDFKISYYKEKLNLTN